MKKIVLLAAIVFTMSSFTTGKENNTMFFQACWQAAWDVGTRLGNGCEECEYYYTNSYAEVMCDDEGNFRHQ